MKNILKNKLVVLGLVLIVAFGVWSLRTHEGTHSHGTATVKNIYYCPMHPAYTSDRPGKCPICHMELVLMKPDQPMAPAPAATAPREFTMEEIMKMKPGELCLLHKCRMGNCMIAMTPELARLGKCPHCGDDLGIVIKDLLPQGYGAVRLGSEKSQMIGVKTEEAKRKNVQKTIRAAGTVAHDAELYQAEAEFIQALNALKKSESAASEQSLAAQDMVEASRIRLRHLGLSEDLIAEVAKQNEANHSLLFAHGGGPVWVYANIYEYEMALVKPGQAAAVESSSYPGKNFKGRVRAVDPMVDMKTRTTRVRILVDNPEELLKPDMFVNASIGVDLGTVLVVPRAAVLDTGTRKIIFVEKPTGQFEPREVVLGAAADDFFPVEQGLQEGEHVVTSGNFLIDSESRMKAALQAAVKGGHVHGA